MIKAFNMLAAFVAPVTVLTLSPAHAEPEAVWSQVITLMRSADAKSKSGDHAAAAALVEQTEAILASQESGFTSFHDYVRRSDIALMHGTEKRLANLGGGCSEFARSRTYALRAQDIATNDGELDQRDAAQGLLKEISQKSSAAGCAEIKGRTDTRLAGHYYLSGVRETGSELVLRNDGSFDWFISYGAIDQFADGRWTSDGTQVILATSPVDMTKPLFALRQIEPWSLEAEQELLRRLEDATWKKIAQRCPFIGPATAFTAAPYLPQVGPDPDILRQRAEQHLQDAIAARSRAETVARAVMEGIAGDAIPDGDKTEEVRSALSEWHRAHAQALDSARSAGLDEPELDEPTMPNTCNAPRPSEANGLALQNWIGGLGVRVVDGEYAQGAKGVRATLHFADGQEETIQTGSRGLAIRPGKLHRPVTAVHLAADFAPGREQDFTIDPTFVGILHFSIDGRQLREPAFETWRLRIDGDGLVPDDFGQGRYERGR